MLHLNRYKFFSAKEALFRNPSLHSGPMFWSERNIHVSTKIWGQYPLPPRNINKYSKYIPYCPRDIQLDFQLDIKMLLSASIYLNRSPGERVDYLLQRTIIPRSIVTYICVSLRYSEMTTQGNWRIFEEPFREFTQSIDEPSVDIVIIIRSLSINYDLTYEMYLHLTIHYLAKMTNILWSHVIYMIVKLTD